MSFLDRFIPNRSKSNFHMYDLECSTSESTLYDVDLGKPTDSRHRPVFLNTAKKAKHVLNYRRLVLGAMNINPVNILIYNTNHKKCNVDNPSSWPVKPRKKPLIADPLNIVDMPKGDRLEGVTYHNMVDWGQRGDLAAVVQGEIILWYPNSDEADCSDLRGSIFNCIKWDKSGEKIAASRTRSRISIIDAATLNVFENLKCHCRDCRITAFEWTKNDGLYAGCSSGAVTLITPTVVSYTKDVADDMIGDLKLSCNENYLLVFTSKKGIQIYKLPLRSNSSPLTIENDNDITIMYAAWHPWEECTLAVGKDTNEISIWDVKTRKEIHSRVVEPFFKKASSCVLDFLTFNPLSGELLVSFYYNDSDDDYSCNFLTVFSDLYTRVDEVRLHTMRVSHAVWNVQGTQLASIGDDGSIVLWEFFGTEAEERIKSTKKDENKVLKVPSMFDPAFQFGSVLR